MRWYHGTFTLYDAGRLWIDATAEVPVATYPPGREPDAGRVAGVDLGIIHPYAAAGPGGGALLVPGRAVARRAPRPGQRGSRRWRKFRRRQRIIEARHRRRVRQAQHEAAKAVVGWAGGRRIGALAVGDPRGVLNVPAGPRHNQRTRPGYSGHRDLSAAASIAARNGGGTTPALPIAAGVTHRRAGAHLPGVARARRDPRRRAHHRGGIRGSPGRHRPAPPRPQRGRGVARHTARSL